MEKELLTNNSSAVKERNYGIDTLRLISMLMVVVLHVLGFGVLTHSYPFTPKGEMFWSLEILCFATVNIYAIISGFVGYKSSHKSSNLVYLCLQVIFFALIFTTLDIAILLNQGAEISFKNVFFNLFPSIKYYWYFSAYFCLFFFMPILDKIIDYASRKSLKIAAIFCFTVFCCWSQLFNTVSSLRWGYSVLWIALLYLLGAYISKYDPLKNRSKLFCFLGFFICIALTAASRTLIALTSQAILGYYDYYNILVSYTSPTITLGAIFLVCGFSKIKLKKDFAKKIIAFLTPMAFGVYLIHCHPAIFLRMETVFAWIPQYHTLIGLLLVIGISLAIFLVCLFADWLRLLIFKLCKIKTLSTWIASAISKITARLLGLFHVDLNDE